MADHSRVAFAETQSDEADLTAATVVVWVLAWFNARGVTVEWSDSDHPGAYRSDLW